MAELPHILFVINSLAGGGAERVLLSLLGLSRPLLESFTFSLALLDDEPRAYAPPEWLDIAQLDTRFSLPRSLLGLDRLVRRRKPDLILSFLTRANVASIAVGGWHGIPVIVSERVETSSHLGNSLSGRIARQMVRIAYPRAQRVIAVSQGIADDLADHYGVARDRLEVIANPVDMKLIRELADTAPVETGLPQDYAVTVSRLTVTKNVALPIAALARSGIDLPLVVLGQGPEADALKAQARELGVADRVFFAGFRENPYGIVSRARFFASGSNAEGFPNGLVEALALGVPVIATNCASGPAEILAGTRREAISGLTEAQYGMLVPVNDTDALADAMRRMEDPELRARYAQAGPGRAAHFSPEKARDAYWAAIAAELAACGKS